MGFLLWPRRRSGLRCSADVSHVILSLFRHPPPAFSCPVQHLAAASFLRQLILPQPSLPPLGGGHTVYLCLSFILSTTSFYLSQSLTFATSPLHCNLNVMRNQPVNKSNEESSKPSILSHSTPSSISLFLEVELLMLAGRHKGRPRSRPVGELDRIFPAWVKVCRSLRSDATSTRPRVRLSNGTSTKKDNIF